MANRLINPTRGPIPRSISNNKNIMNKNIDIIPGQDKFLQLHIEDLSKLTMNEIQKRKPQDRESSIAPIVISASITGFIVGVIAAYCIGLLPN